ncbi:MAG TPA: hypothetical protein VFV17_04455 [Usitatibacteraceae bacterium]|nr:hypothetical protein [Usitatibacteraceae bacterium]
MMRLVFSTLITALVAGCANVATLPASGAYYRNDLTDDKVAVIAIGDTKEVVIAKLGEPWQRLPFPYLKRTAWDYVYRDTWGYTTELSVMIDDDTGRVKERIKNRIHGGRDDK